MNSFLLITTVSPKSFNQESPRKFLFQAFLRGLDSVDYKNFKVILIGGTEIEMVEDRPFLEKRVSSLKTKGERLRELYKDLSKGNDRYDYIARLDDDDLISYSVLKELAHSDADLIADKYHSFLDVVTCQVAKQERPWIANTAFHKWEHGMNVVDEQNGTGLAFDYDHAETWIKYYRDKNIQYLSRENAIYLRILNPLSVTSLNSGDGKELSEKAYIEYLRKFGYFRKKKEVKGFEAGLALLERHNADFGLEIKRQINHSFVKRVLLKLRLA